MQANTEDTVRFRILMWIPAMTLFAALAIPVGLVAQDVTAQADKPKHHHYKFIDLGTLGGPGSGVFDSQRELTRKGAVVGAADTAIPDPYAPNCFDPNDCLVEHGFSDRSTMPGRAT